LVLGEEVVVEITQLCEQHLLEVRHCFGGKNDQLLDINFKDYKKYLHWR
jgi:hypothetical protein